METVTVTSLTLPDGVAITSPSAEHSEGEEHCPFPGHGLGTVVAASDHSSFQHLPFPAC